MKVSHIVCDWAWWYSNRLTGKGRTKFGSGAPGKYHVEKIAKAPEFPVQDLADPDGCMLHFWVTGPHMLDAKVAFDAWGFKFTTVEFTWIKTLKTPKSGKELLSLIEQHGTLGMLKYLTKRNPGHYTASNAEWVSLAWSGKPLTLTTMEHQTIFAPSDYHSRKPFNVHQHIDDNYPGSRCLELFAVPPLWTDSHDSPNEWHYLGFEVDGRDCRVSIPELANA